jgi:hypothetical protein
MMPTTGHSMGSPGRDDSRLLTALQTKSTAAATARSDART